MLRALQFTRRDGWLDQYSRFARVAGCPQPVKRENSKVVVAGGVALSAQAPGNPRETLVVGRQAPKVRPECGRHKDRKLQVISTAFNPLEMHGVFPSGGGGFGQAQAGDSGGLGRAGTFSVGVCRAEEGKDRHQNGEDAGRHLERRERSTAQSTKRRFAARKPKKIVP